MAVEELEWKSAGAIYSDAQLRILRTSEPLGLRLSGEMDVTNADRVRQALHEAGLDGDLYLDLTELLFADVSAIRALVTTALHLASERRLILHGLDPRLEKVIDLVGWSNAPNLVIHPSGASA
jgi:anti-anti-sigma factor